MTASSALQKPMLPLWLNSINSPFPGFALAVKPPATVLAQTREVVFSCRQSPLRRHMVGEDALPRHGTRERNGCVLWTVYWEVFIVTLT